MIRFNSIREIFRNVSHDEAGNILLVTIFAVSVFLGVTGLAVDYGMATMREANLKSATDLAALAGVQELPFTVSAKNKMKEYFESNYLNFAECTVEYDSVNDSCWIVASHPVPTYFMRFFGQNELTVHAKSKAVLENVEGFFGGIGIMPFVLLNPSKNSDPNDDLCLSNHGRPYVLKYAEDNIMVEDWYYNRQIVAEYVEHYDGTLPDGGWRSVLSLDPNSIDPETDANSADDFRTNFANGWGGQVDIGDILDSNPGVMTSGTTQGRKDRLSGNFTDWEGFDPNLDPLNSRIIVVPIVSLGNYDASGNWIEVSEQDIANGDYEWKESRVDGFAAFFLLSDTEQNQLPGGNEIDRKWVVGRYLHGVNIGGEIISSGPSEGPDYGMVHGRLVPFD